MKHLRERLLKEKTNGSFSFGNVQGLCWSDEIKFFVSPLFYTDYEIKEHFNQIRIDSIVENEKQTIIFPRELTTLIVNQVNHYLSANKYKFNSIEYQIEQYRKDTENKLKNELFEIKAQLKYCNKNLAKAISLIGIENLETIKTIISKLNAGITRFSSDLCKTEESLKHLCPEKAVLTSSEHNFYKHYRKMLEVKKTFS